MCLYLDSYICQPLLVTDPANSILIQKKKLLNLVNKITFPYSLEF